jgi:hypothetical protein
LNSPLPTTCLPWNWQGEMLGLGFKKSGSTTLCKMLNRLSLCGVMELVLKWLTNPSGRINCVIREIIIMWFLNDEFKTDH